jgi:phosphonate transport system substrate-binding protein
VKPITGLILVIVLVVISPFSALAESQQDKILIGLIPEMNVFKQMERFRPLAQFLSKETGVTVKLTILSRYGNIIERFTNEKMDGAFFLWQYRSSALSRSLDPLIWTGHQRIMLISIREKSQG